MKILAGYFCSAWFSLEQKGFIRCVNESSVKGLDYAPIQNVELKGDFDDCSFIIKKADKGFCVVVCDRNDYMV